MATYCVVESLHTEWLVTDGLHEQECAQMGGVLVSRGGGGGCGASSAAANTYQGVSGGGVAGRTAALALMPLRLFRSTFAESPVTSQLDSLNTLAAEELEGLFAANPAVGEKVGDALLTVALLAGAMVGASEEKLSQSYYSEALHKKLADAASEVAGYGKGRELRAALEEVVRTSERFAGKSLGEIKQALKRPAAAY
jgi:hypothetical protein